MIFLDTSAIYAIADRDDRNHREARRLRVSASAEGLLTHNYVIVEALALLQRRLGSRVAALLVRNTPAFEVVWVDEKLHEQAAQNLVTRSRRHTSFVDEVSFLVMRSRGIDTAFHFDPDFEREGFRRLSS